MKRIFLSILPFLLFFTSSFNNDFGGKKINSVDTIGYPITQFIGSDSALVKSRGGLMGRFAPIPFTDTTSANLSRISQYPGALIYTSSLDKYWYRNSSKTAWIEFTSSGGSTVNIYNSNGVLTGERTVDGDGNGLSFNSFRWFAVGADSVQFSLNSNVFRIFGLSETQDTTTYKPVVIDPLTGRVLQSSYWFGGSGGGGGTAGIRFDSSYTPLGGKRGVDSFVVKSIRIRRNNVTVVPTEFGDSAAFWNIDVPDTISLSNRINAKADTSLVWKRGGNAGINPTSDWFGTPDSTILLAKVNGKTSWRIDPNGTYMRTTFGYMAGDSLTTGIRNTFFGYYAGGTIKTQESNTAFGANALRFGTGGVAENVAVGYGALTRSQAIRNVGVGSNALTWLTTGKENTSVGNYSSLQNRNGEGNAVLGSSALRGNVKGNFNAAVGTISLTQNTTSIDSIKVVSGGSGYTTATVVISAPTVLNDPGLNSLQATATAVISGGAIVGVIVTEPGKGYTDVADGYSTPVTATITGDGTGAVLSVVLRSGEYNSAFGTSALSINRTGKYNTAVGFGALAYPKYADYNTGVGQFAGANMTGSYNLVLGSNRGDSIGSKNKHVLISDGFGNIKFTSDSVGNSRFWGTGGHRFQSGTTAQRPSLNPALFRYNTDSSKFEWSDGANWYSLGSGGGGGGTTYKIGTYNSQTPNDNGASIVGDSIYMQPFSSEYPGLVPPGGSSSTFLRGDGTWQTIAGGTVYVDSVSSNSAGDSLIVFKDGVRRAYKYPSGSSGLTKGTTTISNSATTRVLYDSSGVLSNNANFTFNQSTNLLQVGGTTGRINAGNFVISVPDANGTYLSAATASLFLISGGSKYGLAIRDNKIYVGGSTTPTATVHITAGSATAGTAPLKFTSGTPTTTPEIGAIQFNNGLFIADSSNSVRDTLATRSWVRWRTFGAGTSGTADGYVDGATYNNSTSTLTITQTGAADVSVTFPGSYVINTIHPDSTSKQINDSTLRLKAVTVSTVDPYLSILTGRTDSTINHEVVRNYVSEPLFSITAGAGFASDTTIFTDSTLYGSFYTGEDSIYITNMYAVLKGQSGDTLGIQVIYNDSINVTGTIVGGGTQAVNSRTTGNAITVSSNQGIPPFSWVWIKSPTVIAGKKPEYLSLTLVGYRKYQTP